MYICICNAVTTTQLRELLWHKKICNQKDFIKFYKIKDHCCGTCVKGLKELINRELEELATTTEFNEDDI